jgi:hypothetical protein
MLMGFRGLRFRLTCVVGVGGTVAGLIAGCTDSRDPVSVALARPVANELAASNAHGSFICTARLAPAGQTGAPSVTCRPTSGTFGGITRTKAEDVVLINQKVNVRLNIGSPAYSSSTHIFSLAASITNLLAQPIGTTDGTTTTTAGTRVYFTSGPVASGGTGSVVVQNPSGSASFLGHTVPYFGYTPLIASGATSAVKTWQFLFAATATGMSFAVEVDAAVPAQNSVLRWIVLRRGLTSNDLNGVWCNTASDIWAVGANNTIVHYDGADWDMPTTGLPSASYAGVFGTSGTDAWAVGTSGTAVHWNGTAWSKVTTGTSANLTAVWGSAPNNYYATGNGGVGLHYNGSSWSTISFPDQVTGNLHGVWGADASHVYMVGDGGVAEFFDGSSWLKVSSPTTQPLLSVWGTSANNVYAAGGLGTMLHFDGNTVSVEPSGTNGTLSGLGGTDASNIWAVGASGFTQHFNGSAWTSVARKSGFLITSICSGPPKSTLWAVGVSGSLLSVSDAQVTLSNQSGLPILGVWASGPTDVWAATIGTVLHYDGDDWTNAYVADDDSMSGIWGSGPSNVFTVGRDGDIARFNGSSWTTAEINPSLGATGYQAVFGIAPDNVYAVGNGGLVEHFDGSKWSFVARTGTGNLRGVWGGVTTHDFYAVADDHTAYIQPSGGNWKSMVFSPANTKGLHAIFATAPTNVWATGDSGVVYQLVSGTTFTLPAATTGTLTNFHGTWNSSATDSYLVGDAGTVLHFDGVNWLPFGVPVTSAFRSIYGTAAQNVYVVGDNGVVLLGTGL